MQLKNVGLLTGAQLANAVAGVIQAIVVVHLFGATRSIEVFFAASVVQQVFARFMQTGQFFEIVLPKYIEIKHAHGRGAANEAASAMLLWLVAKSIVLASILWFAAPWIMEAATAGFGTLDRLTSVSMFRALLPLMIVQVAAGFITSIGNAEQAYGRFEFVACVGTIFSLGMILIAHEKLGAWAMVAALWLGQVISLVGRLALANVAGVRIKAVFRSNHVAHWKLYREVAASLPFVFSAGLFQFVFVNQLTLLPSGSLAIVQYVQSALLKLRGLIVRPTSVVFFTNISESLVKSAGATRTVMQKWLHQLLLLVSLGVAMLWIPLEDVLTIVWKSQEFTRADVAAASELLRYLLITLAFLGVGVLYQKLNVALGRFRQQYVAMAVCECVSATIAFLVIVPLGNLGVLLALFTRAIAYAVASYLVTRFSNRQLAVLARPIVVLQYGMLCAVSLVTGGAIWLGSRPMFVSVEASAPELLLFVVCFAFIQLSIVFSTGWIIRIDSFRQASQAGMQQLRNLTGR